MTNDVTKVLEVVCTNRGQHDSRKLGELAVVGERVRIVRRDGSNLRPSLWYRPPADRLMNLTVENGAVVESHDVIEAKCPVCGRHPQPRQEHLRMCFDAAGQPRVSSLDISHI